MEYSKSQAARETLERIRDKHARQALELADFLAGLPVDVQEVIAALPTERARHALLDQLRDMEQERYQVVWEGMRKLVIGMLNYALAAEHLSIEGWQAIHEYVATPSQHLN